MGCALTWATDAVAAEHADRCNRNLTCRVHSEKGVTLSEQKNYGEALNEFTAAYAAEPAPRLLLNIGRSLYRLDRPQEALDYFARYRKAVTSLDVEAERVLKRYELDAQTALAINGEIEPPPAPLTVPSNRWPPRATVGLLGAGVGFLIIGIGLGAGAINTGKDISQSANQFAIFGPEQQALERRGLNMQASGIAFDVLGLLALTAGAASLGTWLHMKKSAPIVSTTQLLAPSLASRSGASGYAQLFVGGR